MSEQTSDLTQHLPRLEDGWYYAAPDKEEFQKSLSNEERNQFHALKAIIEAFLYDDRIALKAAFNRGNYPALHFVEMIAYYFIAWLKHGASKENLQTVLAAMPTSSLSKVRALGEYSWGAGEGGR
jgi:hypothetical protein